MSEKSEISSEELPAAAAAAPDSVEAVVPQDLELGEPTDVS